MYERFSGPPGPNRQATGRLKGVMTVDCHIVRRALFHFLLRGKGVPY
jgi:hypothetical protein